MRSKSGAYAGSIMPRGSGPCAFGMELEQRRELEAQLVLFDEEDWADVLED